MPSRSTTCPAIFLQCAFYSVSLRNNFFVIVDFRITSLSISYPYLARCYCAAAEKAKYNSEENSMKTNVSNFTEFRKYYLSEFELYDGEAFITFNIVGIDLDRNEVQVAVTDRGKISVVTYDLMTDKNGRLYFEYGGMFERVYLDEFDEAA